jgi:bla regulator protein blaR1
LPPLVCLAGVTGAHLKTGIEQLMRIVIPATVLVAAVAIPVSIGMGTGRYLLAQTPKVADTTKLTFEVASVKPHKSDDQRVTMVAQPGGRFTATNITLPFLIRTAYRLQDDQISGGPDWLASDRFDIVAKAEDSVPPTQLLSMIQTLLADRFKLALHHDTKELPIYALVLARSDGTLGSQLRRNDCVRDDTRRPTPPPDATQPPPCGSISNGFGRLTLRGTPLAQVLQFLSPAVNRVVVDRTGLIGNFDLDLTWMPNNLPQRAPGTPADQPIRVNGVDVDPNGPSIFTAVQEQLGLKLESTKGPVDVLVIDHVEQPAPD